MDKPRLLLVDDVEDNLFVLQETISEHLPDCEIVCASSGQEALAQAQDGGFSCVLLDMHMPVMDGVEVTRRLRESEAAAHVPVILITAFKSTPAFRAHALEAGADDFVAKPVNNVELAARIKVMLRVQRAEQELRELNARLQGLLAERTEALGESEERYRDLFDRTANCVLVLDTEGRFIEANRAACRFFECDRETLLASDLGDFGRGDKRERLAKYLPLLDAGGALEMEFVVRGKHKALDLTATAGRWREQRVFIGVGTDANERRRSEREALRVGGDEAQRLAEEMAREVAPAMKRAADEAQSLAGALAEDISPRAEAARQWAAHAAAAAARTEALARLFAAEPPRPESLAAALKSLAEELGRAYGAECSAEAEPGVALGGEACAALWRIAREAARAAALAGAARVRIALTPEGPCAALEITDEGAEETSEAESRRAAALPGMKLLAAAVGATLEARWNPEGGTTVVCRAPLGET